MKIKKFYSEKNEISDISGDYYQIEMSADNFNMIKSLLITGKWLSKELKARAKAIAKTIEEADERSETEWY